MTEIEKLVRLSNYAGERFDLVQAGGGNASVKLDDGQMIIKASGFLLSEVDSEKGYSRVVTSEVLSILDNKDVLKLSDKRERDRLSSMLLQKHIIGSSARPSIETFMHALLPRYTLHTHPLVVNAITCRKNWAAILAALFKDRAAYIEYRTPGLELALELRKAVKHLEKSAGAVPGIFFLRNHGLIVSSDQYDDVRKITEDVLAIIEGFLGVDMNGYKLTNSVSALINALSDTTYLAYLSFDAGLSRLILEKRELFRAMPFCPDGLVYCGMQPLEIENLDDPSPFIRYRKEHFELPRVVLYNDHLFFIARSLKKAREIEEVFKFHIMSLDLAGDDVTYLSEQELCYLGNWEAEQYRRKL